MMKHLLYVLILLLALSCRKEEERYDVKVAGAMRNVMWKGELQGSIALDTLSNTPHVYGLGPLEGLSGELLLMDSKVITSRIGNNSEVVMEEGAPAKAPFFVYAEVKKWKKVSLPDSVTGFFTLERFLRQGVESKGAFPFRLSGRIAKAKIHIVNLPPGSVVSSPEDAHRGQVNFSVASEEVEMLGFFSTAHKGVFTHHNSDVHVHLLTKDGRIMGHADDVRFAAKDVVLLLPE